MNTDRLTELEALRFTANNDNLPMAEREAAALEFEAAADEYNRLLDYFEDHWT